MSALETMLGISELGFRPIGSRRSRSVSSRCHPGADGGPWIDPYLRGGGDAHEPDISQLISRAKAGDDTAIREFLNRFEPEVRIMVRGRLPRKLRTRFDSMDFVQAVWQSFFTDSDRKISAIRERASSSWISGRASPATRFSKNIAG